MFYLCDLVFTKEKTKTKSKADDKSDIAVKTKPSKKTVVKEKPTKKAKTKVKPPREATVTISLIENPVTTEEKIYNAMLRIEQLIQSDVAISREDLFDLGEDIERQLKEILPDYEDATIAEIEYQDVKGKGTFNVEGVSWKDIALGWVSNNESEK